MSDKPATVDLQQAAAELAHLQRQIEAARTVLVRLQQDEVEAQAWLDSHEARQLLEANEQLVMASLRAQAEADTASLALDAVARHVEHDALTRLPNRLLLLDRFEHAIASARRHGGRVACMFLDLDGFKEINDSLGHDAGDQVLQGVAARLVAATRAADTVSRHGGDEFVILLPEVVRSLDAAHVAEKILAALKAPGLAAGQGPGLSASIGISFFPDDSEDARTLIRFADAAMYQAKRRGAGNCVFYGPGSVQASFPSRAVGAPGERELRQAELREANAALVLAALSAQEMQAAAEASHLRQVEFTAVVAHELRNPLAPLRIAASMLGRADVDGSLLPRLQGIIERQVSQMTRLVNDLTDASPARTGQLSLSLRQERVDMAAVIDTAIETCRPALDARRQHFEAHRPAGVYEVQGDAVRLVQALSNLLDNASKYTPEGGTVTLSAEVTGSALVITLEDDGIGITAQALPQIFDPFVRDVHAIGFNSVGLGIGLAVVQALVRGHGGSVVASSEGIGRGSRFVVTLPLCLPEANPRG